MPDDFKEFRESSAWESKWIQRITIDLGEDAWFKINELASNLIANCNRYFFVHTAEYGLIYKHLFIKDLIRIFKRESFKDFLIAKFIKFMGSRDIYRLTGDCKLQFEKLRARLSPDLAG